MSSKNQRSENKKNSNLRLISSTIKNLSKKGINDLTMNDVSQGAGLSQGIVNFHFKSKELLLIETLKFISNEYLTSFDKYLKKAGDDPKLKIINMIENDFSSKICSPEKISVWFTFLSETKFKPAYRQICRKRDLYYQNVTEDIFDELLKIEKNKLSKKNLAIAFHALIMGLWLNQLDEPMKYNRKESKKICLDYLKSHFPKQFKEI
ncbi:TetR family transcriptional regulator C-terminal domain-containing protein [Alphaproteobacteria bacterium]|jgi:AcrR family transcriptional regulator|nr:TetR family transcriptional regulator C-terminal domain-containing protein [Alphaproteobacteria bacterium]